MLFPKFIHWVKNKGTSDSFDGTKKDIWDVSISMNIMRLVLKLDMIFLVSGEGDFFISLDDMKKILFKFEISIREGITIYATSIIG